MGRASSPRNLTRDVTAVVIPDGTDVVLDAGLECIVTQALGNSYTIQLASGAKFRVAGHEGDAIGMPVMDDGHAQPAPEDAEPLPPEEAEKVGWDALKTVHDPEIPINVVELGLVYTLKMHKRGDGRLLAEVRMTLTAPGCGMGDVLLRDVERALKTIPGVATVDAKIVFDPVWNPYTMMSEAARLQLGML